MVKFKLYLTLNIIFAIIACILGYLQYGLIGIVAMLLLDIILGLLSLLGLVPIIGVIFYFLIGHYNATQEILLIFGLPYSWVAGLLLILNGIIAAGWSFHIIERVFTTWWRLPS